MSIYYVNYDVVCTTWNRGFNCMFFTKFNGCIIYIRLVLEGHDSKLKATQPAQNHHFYFGSLICPLICQYAHRQELPNLFTFWIPHLPVKGEIRTIFNFRHACPK